LADELRAPILEELVQPFETSHNVDVQIQMVDFDDLLDTFKATAETEEGPDILIGPHDWLGELVANDFIAPLEIDEQQRANFLPSATFGFTYDEKLYGIPYAVENVAFFRNTDLVPEAPETWYEVAQIAAQLEAEGKVKQGFVLHADAYHAYPLHTAFGGALFGWDSRGQYDPTNVRLDSEASIAAARWLEAMTQGGHLTGDMNWNTMHAMFESGDSAMLITGPWALERIRESGIPYAISHLPEETEESLPFVGIQGFMVNAHGAHSDLAESFLTDFVLTESVMDALFEAGLRPSAYLPTRQNIDDPDLATFAAVGSNGLPMPAIPEMSAVWDAWEGSIAHILKQEQSADEAYRNAADQIRAIIAETPPPPQSP
jgi:maltose-binding protein MalE